MQSHVAGRCSPSNLEACSSAIEASTGIYLQRMSDLAGQKIDLAEWTKYWAFDTNSTINFGRDFGFMKKGGDIKGIITGNDTGFHVGALIGQVPWVNRFILENKALMRLLAYLAGTTDPTADFVEVMQDGSSITLAC